MNVAAFVLAMQSARVNVEPIAPQINAAIVVEAGNGLYPRPPHSDTLNGGCNEWDTEAPELATDGTPCVRTVDNYVKTDEFLPGHGDAKITVDDITPMSCDTGTGFWMVTSVRQARQLQWLNPATVCESGERYGATS